MEGSGTPVLGFWNPRPFCGRVLQCGSRRVKGFPEKRERGGGSGRRRETGGPRSRVMAWSAIGGGESRFGGGDGSMGCTQRYFY